MAKTQYSLSDDQTKLGRPTGFEITVRDAYVSAGAVSYTHLLIDEVGGIKDALRKLYEMMEEADRKN